MPSQSDAAVVSHLCIEPGGGGGCMGIRGNLFKGISFNSKSIPFIL